MKISKIKRKVSAYLCLSALLFASCRTTPLPDPTEDYRHDLCREIGFVRDSFAPDVPDGKSLNLNEASGPAASLYRRYYRFDSLFAGTPHQHRMGVLQGPVSLGVQLFLPESGYRGTVFLLHGYLDHTGPLLPLAAAVLKQGYAVVAFDLPGHGFSGGERGGIGNFDDYGKAVERIIGLSESSGGRHLPRPWVAVGHSTGAAAFYIYLHERTRHGLPSPFSKVIFIAPLVRSAHWKLSSAALSLFGWVNRYYKPRNIPDPLLGIYSFPVSWAERLREWNDRVSGYESFAQKGILIQGTEDEVVDFRFNVPFLLRKIKGLELREIPGAGHVPYTDTRENRDLVRTLTEYLDGLDTHSPQ